MIVENYWKMLASIQTNGYVAGVSLIGIENRTISPGDGSTDRVLNNLVNNMGAVFGSNSTTPMSYYDTNIIDRISDSLVSVTGMTINIARDIAGMTRVFTITGRNYGNDITIKRVGITKTINWGGNDNRILLAEVDLAEPIFVPGGDHNFNILLAWDDKDVAQMQTN